MNLVLDQLVAQVGNFKLSIPHLEIHPGEILGVMGRSGTGKSTLLHAVAGFAPVVSGTIRAEEDLTPLAPERRRSPLVFQRGSLFSHLTVRENVEFGLRAMGMEKNERRQRAGDWLAALRISELSERLPHEISGGQAQRVALARAFSLEWPRLLMDEPFSALDPALREKIRNLTAGFVREKEITAILVTHDLKDLESHADRIAILDEGKLLQVGTIQSLRESPAHPVVSEVVG